MEEKNLQPEEGALKVTKLTLYESAAIIVGANIGSGILGLAYSSRKAGWPILLLWLIIAGVFTTFSMLYVAESALRTKKPLQLPGLAEKYVGKLGAVLVFISVVANSMGCMIAYTSGSGNILCTLLGIPNWAGSLLFTVPCVLVVWLGLKATGLWEKFMSTGSGILPVRKSGRIPSHVCGLDLCRPPAQQCNLLLHCPICCARAGPRHASHAQKASCGYYCRDVCDRSAVGCGPSGCAQPHRRRQGH